MAKGIYKSYEGVKRAIDTHGSFETTRTLRGDISDELGRRCGGMHMTTETLKVAEHKIATRYFNIMKEAVSTKNKEVINVIKDTLEEMQLLSNNTSSHKSLLMILNEAINNNYVYGTEVLCKMLTTSTIDTKNAKYSDSPLHTAMTHPKLDRAIVDTLIKHAPSAIINWVNEQNQSPLYLALQTQNKYLVAKLYQCLTCEDKGNITNWIDGHDKVSEMLHTISALEFGCTTEMSQALESIAMIVRGHDRETVRTNEHVLDATNQVELEYGILGGHDELCSEE